MIGNRAACRCCMFGHLVLFFLEGAEVLKVLQKLQHQHLLLRLLVDALQALR